MKIAYIVAEDISIPSGVLKKIEAKLKYWRLCGHDVTLISLKSNGTKPLLKDAIILSQYVKEKNIKKKLLRRLLISKKLDDCLSSIRPDLVYTRYISGSPDLVHILKKYAPYIVEINTNDVEEFKNGKRSRYIFNLLTRSYFLGSASGFVSVSHELMNHKEFTKFNKKFVVVGNGYDFSDVQNKKLYFNNIPKFIFIGSPNQAWHGTDKIIKLANLLERNEFHIVGPNRDDIDTNEKIGKNIIFHGYCDSEYLKKLIPQCDIGISTLALHRNNMREASPLKSREYLAYGLPIIIGYEDTDLTEKFSFVLNIGNYENNLIEHVKEIENYIDSFIGVDPMTIVNAAKDYLDYEVKEKQRLSFIEKVQKKGHIK